MFLKKKNKSVARALSDTSVAFTDSENVGQTKAGFIRMEKAFFQCFS